MATTIRMRFAPDLVTVEVPEKGYFDSTPNLVIYNRDTGQLLGIGENRKAYQQELQAKQPALSDNTASTAALGVEDISQKTDLMVLEYYLYRYQAKISRCPIFPYPMKWVDYDLIIADYEKWSEPRQRTLQYTLQMQYGARKLTINGTGVNIPPGKRLAASISFFLVKIVSLAAFWFALLGSLQWSVWSVVLGLAGALAFAFLGHAGWLLFTKMYLLPDDYVKFYLITHKRDFFLKTAAQLLRYK
jgi:hypothetical protein